MKKDSRRLFTFGCSYTVYSTGPTWADLLGLEFEHFENWGIPGLGCRAIAERVAECHAKYNFTKDDIVVVQWTTHLRHDYHNPEAPKWSPSVDKLNWKTSGSIFSQANQKILNDKWRKQFFYEPSFIMHCLNHILMTQMLLENTGCTWYMTSIGDWCKLSSDLDGIAGLDDKFTDRPQITIQEQIPEYLPWVKMIWEDRSDRWVKPLALHAQEMPLDYQYFGNPRNPTIKLRERHPSTRHYMTWLNQYLRPKLGLSEAPEEYQLWCNTIEQITKDNYSDQEKFFDVMGNRAGAKPGWWPEDPDYWPTWIKGW
jgi:hypothetical protein